MKIKETKSVKKLLLSHRTFYIIIDNKLRCENCNHVKYFFYITKKHMIKCTKCKKVKRIDNEITNNILKEIKIYNKNKK